MSFALFVTIPQKTVKPRQQMVIRDWRPLFSYPAYKFRCRPFSLRRSKKQIPTRLLSTLCYVSYIYPSHESFNTIVHSMVGGAACLSFALAFIPLLNFEESNDMQNENDELETIKWSVASVCSFLPCFNWTSWLLIAFDSKKPIGYYFLSLLYILPLLQSGFNFDSFSIFMLILGICHMQVERIAQTEPSFFGTLKREESGLSMSTLLSGLKTLSESIQKGLPISDLKSMGKHHVKSKTSSFTEMVDRELIKTEEELKDAKELARLEKKFWDDQFDERT